MESINFTIFIAGWYCITYSNEYQYCVEQRYCKVGDVIKLMDIKSGNMVADNDYSPPRP